MTWNGFFKSLFGYAICILFSSSVWSYDEPAVNLGYTSFLDGGPPAGPGFYFQNYLQYYSTHRFNDLNGNPLPLPRTDLNLTADITQVIYLSKYRLLGGNLGVSALLPWLVEADLNDGLNNMVLKSKTGNGDLFIGPALQFDPVMRSDGQGPWFINRLELDFIVPVGQHNRNAAINPGSHFWSFNPYWAATVWVTPRWSTSVRLHYLWNAKNTEPNIAFGPAVFSTQAGQAIFGDFATEYGLTEKFHIGINGYFFNQITDTRVNNIAMPGRQESVWAIGPGILYGLTKNQFLIFNIYSEQDAKNRPEGSNFILRYVLHI